MTALALLLITLLSTSALVLERSCLKYSALQEEHIFRFSKCAPPHSEQVRFLGFLFGWNLLLNIAAHRWPQNFFSLASLNFLPRRGSIGEEHSLQRFGAWRYCARIFAAFALPPIDCGEGIYV